MRVSGLDFGFSQNLPRARGTNAIKVGQANFCPLIARKINTFNSRHRSLPLSLFVFWIFANDEDHSFAPNNSALGTTLANGGRNFHEILLTCGCYQDSQRSDYTVCFSIRPYFSVVLRWLQDSQDEGFSFGDGNRMFKMRRQRPISRYNRPLDPAGRGFRASQ
jgi:hypothetical protein